MDFFQEITTALSGNYKMFTLFKIEWSRISKTSYFAALLHLILLVFMVSFGLIFSQSIGFKISLALMYGLCGMLFAYLQIRLYKEPGQWIYLLNRPMSEKQAFGGLLLSAALFFLLVIVLPFGLVTAILDGFSQQIIDQRHYLQLFYLFGISISCYLVVCFLSLTENKWLLIVLILPVLTLMSLNLGGHVLLLQSLIIALLLALVLLVFKINRQQPLQGRVLIIVFTLVMQWCGFVAINSVVSVIELTQAEISHISQQNANNALNQYPNDFDQLTYLSNKDIIAAGLSSLPVAEQVRYERMMSLNDAHRIRKRVWFHPTEQQLQLMDERPLVLTDPEQNKSWTFSHDEMLFVGLNQDNLTSAGYLGPSKSGSDSQDFNDNERFKGIPWIAGDQFIVSNILYRFDPDLPQVEQVFSAQNNEKILNVLQQQGSINSIITDQSLYLFDDIQTQKNEFPLLPFLSMPLPDDYNNLWGAYVIEIKKKYLLSLLYGKDQRKDVYDAFLKTYEFDLSGQITPLVTQPLNHSSTMAMRYLDYLISPVWTVIHDQFPPLPNRDRYLQHRPWPQPLPDSILWAMATLAWVYFMVTVYWSRKYALTLTTTIFWSITNAITGLPGLLSYLLLMQNRTASTQDANTRLIQNPKGSMEVTHV